MTILFSKNYNRQGAENLRAISDFFCVHLRENTKRECWIDPLTLPVLPQMHAEKVADYTQILSVKEFPQQRQNLVRLFGMDPMPGAFDRFQPRLRKKRFD
jgi:hypothetical protein